MGKGLMAYSDFDLDPTTPNTCIKVTELFSYTTTRY